MRKILTSPNWFIVIGLAVGASIGAYSDNTVAGIALGLAGGIIIAGKQKQNKVDE